MYYRTCKMKYEHIIFAIIILKQNLNQELKVNIHEFISYKTILLKKLALNNYKISLDLSPKVRREFDIIYGDLVKSYYDYQNGLIYFIENNKYISKLKEIIESDLERYPVYNVLLDENLLIEALEIDTLRSVKRLNNKHF